MELKTWHKVVIAIAVPTVVSVTYITIRKIVKKEPFWPIFPKKVVVEKGIPTKVEEKTNADGMTSDTHGLDKHKEIIENLPPEPERPSA